VGRIPSRNWDLRCDFTLARALDFLDGARLGLLNTWLFVFDTWLGVDNHCDD
jgi:hypothetical protein